MLYEEKLLDDAGVIRLQDAELYIKDRIAQARSKEVREAVPHAHQTPAVEIVAGMKF